MALKEGALRAARQRMRMTQEEAARRVSAITGAKVHAHNLYAWERGTARPPRFALQALCTILNVEERQVVARVQ